MRIYPAPHYTMGGLWVDYNLMTTIPGLYAIGEANFSDHGANRLGASALMQGLADGYFVLPYTIGDYLADWLERSRCPTDDAAFSRGERGQRSDRATPGHRRDPIGRLLPPELGKIDLGLLRHGAHREGLEKALARSRRCRTSSGRTCKVSGDGESHQPVARDGRAGRGLPRAGRADVPRRAGPRRVVRRPLPARAPDRRKARRSATTRTSPTCPPGSGPVTRSHPDAPQGATRVRIRASDAEELQVMNLNSRVWRQAGPDARAHSRLRGRRHQHDASFLEMLDVLNEQLDRRGRGADRVRHDCREGICGTCG